MINKTASAHWSGSLKDGTGTVSTQTGVLDATPYGFNSRFEGGTNTNPEELIGAAHAACFSMALSMVLGEHEMTAQAIDTKATVTLEEGEGGFAITKVHLDVTADIPGADPAKFQEAATAAKQNCPVSKVLKGAEITMDAVLV